MRLIGNMLIWVLGQRFAQAGAFIISTNTDGLFLSGLTVDEAQEIIDDYIADYNMPVDPLSMSLDSSMRQPQHVLNLTTKKTSLAVQVGTLGHAITLEFSPFSIGRNVNSTYFGKMQYCITWQQIKTGCKTI